MFYLIMMIYLFNLIFSLYLILYRDRSTFITWFWLLVFLVMPICGFILFLFFGKGMSRNEYEKVKREMVEEFNELAWSDSDNDRLSNKSVNPGGTQALIQGLTNEPLTRFNQITLFLDGKEKFDGLKKDISLARHSIHIEYYAFITDGIGESLLEQLTKKANEGVQVCLLYDKMGSKGTSPKKFNPLKEAGGKVIPFLGSQQSLFSFGSNYHNHHKNVVIDGRIGYIGGFNVADQYVGTTQKFGYWRDTHLRIFGAACAMQQLQFLINWNLSVPETQRLALNPNYLFNGSLETKGQSDIQLVSSNPMEGQQQIKFTFVKLILSATKRLWIQTPYFIPDESVMEALVIAKKSGVDVKLMIPCMPDHPFVYRATEYYAQLAMAQGIEVYTYQGGFLHAKVLIMDEAVSVVGSANQDVRSYKLNFESSAVVYDQQVTQELSQAFERDLASSNKITQETVLAQSKWTRLKQKISRLLSPIM